MLQPKDVAVVGHEPFQIDYKENEEDILRRFTR